MNSVKVDVQRINKKLEHVAKALKMKDRKKIYRAAAKPLTKEAKKNTPKDSGLLRKSIGVLPIGKKQDAIYVGPRVKGKTPAPFYAHWIEYGKKGYDGVAYMRTAYQTTKDLVLKGVEAGLSKAYETIIKGVSNR
jgi:HK97 gp10 family phage protein